jgi:hypothetical protein
MGAEACIQGVGGKTEGTRSIGKPGHKWEDIITMDLGEIVWSGMDWIHLAEDRDPWQAVMNMVMNLWVPKNVGKL